MKVQRLLEITLWLLACREGTTARQLAERFQVSTRTIYRDMEILSSAGIPVYMSPGSGGGISLLPTYLLPRNILSQSERENIMAALQALQVTQLPEAGSVLAKMGGLFKDLPEEEWVRVDFTPWGSPPQEGEKFRQIKQAVMERRVLRFVYVSVGGSTGERMVEGLQLWYKGHAWYLRGYCRVRQDFRVFRLSRIQKLQIMNEKFFRRKLPEDFAGEIPGWGIGQRIKLQFSSAAAQRVWDEFSSEDIQIGDNGRLHVELQAPEDEWLYGYLLSFGAAVTVMEPKGIREILRQKGEAIAALYQ